MFAGATREVVFSKPEVIERVVRDFVPVALKAAHVNNPPAGVEGRLMREIGRSKPAPQGICVANSAGKALAWALSFDDDASVPAFFDYCVKRYTAHPGAGEPFAIERFMKFPSHRLADVEGTADVPEVATVHTAGELCPANPRLEEGTLIVRLVGRRITERGSLAENTTCQENYVEDLFYLWPELQAEVAHRLRRADGERVRLPDRFARALATHAYLGQLDVRPLQPPVPDHRGDTRALALWAEPFARADEKRSIFRIEGESDVRGGTGGTRRPDGAAFTHDVELGWNGFLELDGERVTKLALLAAGRERLEWGNPRFRRMQREGDVRRLMAGRPIDLDSEVRYGIVARPIAPGDAVPASRARGRRPFGEGGPTQDFLSKLARFRSRLQRHGGDLPSATRRTLQRLQRLMRANRFAEAERLLDRSSDPVQPGRAVPLVRDEAIGRKLRRIHAAVQELIQSGHRARAEELLDQAWELFRHGQGEKGGRKRRKL